MSIQKIYREIARNHGVTAKEVEGEIKKAVRCAYFSGNRSGIFGKGIPSNEAFIKWAVEKVINDSACGVVGR